MNTLDQWKNFDESKVDNFIKQTYLYMCKKLTVEWSIFKVEFLKSMWLLKKIKFIDVDSAIEQLEYQRNLNIRGLFGYVESFSRDVY